LPVVPRVVIHVDPGVRSFNFRPDGKSLVTIGYVDPDELQNRGFQEVFRIQDCASGELLWYSKGAKDGQFSWHASPDRRWWCRDVANDRVVQIFDAVNRRFETLRNIDQAERMAISSFSGDSRFLLIDAVVADSPELAIWDLHDQRLRATLPGAKLPADVLAVGDIIAATVPESIETARMRVFDLKTMRLLSTLPGEDRDQFHDFRFSSDGTHGAATYTKYWDGPGFLGDALAPICRGLRHWNLATLQAHVAEEPNTCGGFSFDRGRLLTLHADAADLSLRLRDLATGQARELTQFSSIEAAPLFGERWVAPDGQLLVVQAYGNQPSYFQQWAESIGLNWPFKNGCAECRVYETQSGRLVGIVPGCSPRWSTDSRTIATFLRAEYPSDIGLWDIPARKSLTWFAAGAVLLALPIVLLARRRVRRLEAA
jgi:WD40 repeat protein